MKRLLLAISDAEILAMHADADVPPNVLDPVTVRALVERLTDTEAEQLRAYADHAQFPTDWPIRVSSWLIRRFDLHANHAKGAR